MLTIFYLLQTGTCNFVLTALNGHYILTFPPKAKLYMFMYIPDHLFCLLVFFYSMCVLVTQCPAIL